MKKSCLKISVFILILIFILLPASFISANPGNLVKNGDFSNGNDFWTSSGTVNFISEEVFIDQSGYIEQSINTSRKNLKYIFDINPDYFDPNNIDSGLRVGFDLYSNNGTNFEGTADYFYRFYLPVDTWSRDIEFYISDCYRINNFNWDLPDFDRIVIFLKSVYGGKAYFDNIRLIYPETVTEIETETSWVRTMQMMCYHVWVNEDDNFQFIFWYPYADNNWVRIYDMEGKMVFETDMPWDNPNLIVELPDGTYMVKTYHDQPEPLQEFIIAK